MGQDFLGKKYVLIDSKNFDGYMKELGVGLALRKMGNSLYPKCVLTAIKDGWYNFTIETPYRCSSIDFRQDQEFLEVTLDNRVVNSVCHVEGNIFTQEQKARGLKTTKIVREYKDDKLITTLTVGNVKAVRVYGVEGENETKTEGANEPKKDEPAKKKRNKLDLK